MPVKYAGFFEIPLKPAIWRLLTLGVARRRRLQVQTSERNGTETRESLGGKNFASRPRI